MHINEALLVAGMIEDGKSNIKMMIQFHPESIPMKVYNYRLEDDPNVKLKILESLKQKHKNHWFVKTLG